MEQRETWHEYFMRVAEVVSSRATCDRKHVGAVIVLNNTIVSTGYNGSPRGMPHCDEVGHEMKDLGGRQSCVRTIHAELNAIIQAAKNGARIDGGTLYTTASPCYDCMKAIINAGIVQVVCKEFYASRYGMSEDMIDFALKAGVNIYLMDNSLK